MKDVVELYRNHERAAPYRKMDMEANGGVAPENTVLNNHICFCLIKPTYDQCADPIYTMLRVNLPTWHKQRAMRRTKSSCIVPGCVCSTSWFGSFTSSETALVDALLCKPTLCPELKIQDDQGEMPGFHKPACSGGDCDKEECLKMKLKQLRACKIEFPDSSDQIRYRKYSKMPRTRSDGTEYTEVELVYVNEGEAEFSATMLSATEAYLAHRGEHHWAVRQRKLCIEKLKQAESIEELAKRLHQERGSIGAGGTDSSDGTIGEAPPPVDMAQLMQQILSANNPHRLTITNQDAIVFTDFAAKSKYTNFYNSTCDHPEQGTLCIAVVLHSPAERSVKVDVTVTEQLETGLEDMPNSNASRAPQKVKQGQRQV